MSLSQTAEEQSFLFFTATVEHLELPEIQVSLDKVLEGRGRGCGQTRRNRGKERVCLSQKEREGVRE